MGLLDIDITDDTMLVKSFAGNLKLTFIDLSSFDMGKVKDMNGMFYDCHNLNKVNFGTSFNTSSVTNMGSMFLCCSKLTKLDLSIFDTSSCTDMGYMFGGCCRLTELDISSFDTSRTTNMWGMFSGCGGLKKLHLGNLDVSNVTDMECMFYLCESLTTVTGTITGISCDLDLAQCPLTTDSAMVFINGLADLNDHDANVLILHHDTCNSLTAKQRRIATKKNWIIEKW